MITLIYDLETSGFSPMPMFSKYHKILQICAMRLDTEKVFTSFVDPGMKAIPAWSSAIHKITIEDVRGKGTIQQVIKSMFKELEIDPEEQGVEMIAHNNNLFDELVLRKEMADELPRTVKFWDTLPFMRRAYPKLVSYNLTSLYQHFYNTAFKNAHRADADVFALAKIYKEHVRDKRELCAIDPHEHILRDCLVDIHMIGEYRAQLIAVNLGLGTVREVREFFKTKNDKRYLDTFLVQVVKMRNVTQRMFVIAHILEMKPSDPQLRQYVSDEQDEDDDTLDPVDYYVKYRYFVGEKPTRIHRYHRGLFMIKNQES